MKSLTTAHHRHNGSTWVRFPTDAGRADTFLAQLTEGDPAWTQSAGAAGPRRPLTRPVSSVPRRLATQTIIQSGSHYTAGRDQLQTIDGRPSRTAGDHRADRAGPAAADEEPSRPSRPGSSWCSTSAARCGPPTSTDAAGSRSPSRRSTRWSTRCPRRPSSASGCSARPTAARTRRSVCQDTQQIVPVGPVDRTAAKAAVATLRPTGFTPVGLALRSAAAGPGHRRHHPADRADHRRRGHLRPAGPVRGGPGTGRPGHQPGRRHPRPGPRREGPPAAALHRRAPPAGPTPPRRAPRS